MTLSASFCKVQRVRTTKTLDSWWHTRFDRHNRALAYFRWERNGGISVQNGKQTFRRTPSSSVSKPVRMSKLANWSEQKTIIYIPWNPNFLLGFLCVIFLRFFFQKEGLLNRRIGDRAGDYEICLVKRLFQTHCHQSLVQHYHYMTSVMVEFVRPWLCFCCSANGPHYIILDNRQMHGAIF